MNGFLIFIVLVFGSIVPSVSPDSGQVPLGQVLDVSARCAYGITEVVVIGIDDYEVEELRPEGERCRWEVTLNEYGHVSAVEGWQISAYETYSISWSVPVDLDVIYER